MSLKVLHTADWHFRGKDIEEIEKCVRFIVDNAKVEKPDLIVISGDITDSRSLQLESRAAQIVIEIITEMLDIAPVAIVTGTPSHDGKTALALRSLRGQYPVLVSDYPGQFGYKDNAFISLDSGFFSHGRIDPDFIVTQLPTPTKQFFLNNMTIEDSDNSIAEAMGVLFSGFGQHAGIYGDIPHIVNGHLSVGGAYISETQQLIGKDIEVSKGQLNSLGADVICLGHIHKAQRIGREIFYAGSPTAMNFGEKDEKGCYMHSIGETLVSDFKPTPAQKLIDIKDDFTKENFDIDKFNNEIDAIVFSSKLHGSKIKITLTMWQDEASTFDKEAFEKLFYDAGCNSVSLFLIRKPRETVRSEKVLSVDFLADKLKAMAELRGEGISSGVIQKADMLEALEPEPWIYDYNYLKNEGAK